MTNNEIKPYTGHRPIQALHLAYVDRWVKVLNRPVLVGEFEVQQDDPNGATFQDQLTGLMAPRATAGPAGRARASGACARRLGTAPSTPRATTSRTSSPAPPTVMRPVLPFVYAAIVLTSAATIAVLLCLQMAA